MPFDALPRNPEAWTPDEDAADQALWLLAQVRSNQINRAQQNLLRQGYGCFVPRAQITRRSGRRIVPQCVSLFPGYAFVRVAHGQAWRAINHTFGVRALVMRAPNAPQPVPADVMADLFARTGADGMLRPVTELATGDTIRITGGAMTGIVARVEHLEGDDRVGVLLEIMGRAVRASLPPSHVLRLAI
ncbi:MAG: transcription termination/antitermination NusG family protein [Pseudomonadota bacterium]